MRSGSEPLPTGPPASCKIIEKSTPISKTAVTPESLKGEEFPQTSTIFQWFDLEEFEAYRQLGYLMGWAYLANVGFTDAELTPFAACRSF